MMMMPHLVFSVVLTSSHSRCSKPFITRKEMTGKGRKDPLMIIKHYGHVDVVLCTNK